MRALWSAMVLAGASLMSGCFFSSFNNDWQDFGLVTCTPGSTVSVGCNSSCGLGSCTGDPVMRVCNGTVSATACEGTIVGAAERIGENDDAACGGGLCPALQNLTCPASGSLRVVVRSFSTSRGFTCSLASR